MADKTYKLTFAMTDGTNKDVQFTSPQGPMGSRGISILKVTKAPSSYTTATGGFTPTYRIALSTVKSQSNATEVLVGDTIMYSYYHYPVGYVDTSYVYLGARNSIRGSTGAAGAAGADGATPVKGTDYWTAADQEAIVNETLSLAGLNLIPDYVTTEADEVLSRVMDAQTSGRVFTMIAIADTHYGSGDYTEGILHAAQGIKYIADRIHIDALNIHGDYTDKYISENYEGGMADIHDVHALLSGVDADWLTVGGNHDFYATGDPKVAKALFAKSDNVVWGSRTGGYYYRDFDDYKLRIITLNTAETTGSYANLSCTDEQYNWFISTLDMSAKADADEWQILILSHHPLDWLVTDDSTYRMANILDAYTNGTSWSGGGLSCDFTGKNAARIICNIHAHLHNLLVDKICLGMLGMTSNTTDVYRMCLPEACFNRPQSYGGKWNTETAYTKTASTAEDTAFSVVCIDLENYTVKIINYGAGVDRHLAYHDPSAPAYDNVLLKAVGSDGNPYNGGQGWKSGYRLNSSGAEASNSSYCVTGFIPVSSYDYVYLKNMNLVCGTEANEPNTRVALYDSSFTYITGKSVYTTLLTDTQFGGADGYILDDAGNVLGSADIGGGANIARMRIVYGSGNYYIRISTKLIDATSVVTINEEIV